jgi:uncharacterized protein
MERVMQFRRRDFLRTSAAAASATLLAGAVEERRNGMPYRTLGRTGERVSLLALGGFHMGMPGVEEADAIRIMRTAADEGVNFFDNAWNYYGGLSEERMGKALKDGYRDKVFLMTKTMARDRAKAESDLEMSLRRLDVDVIDLWQMHQMVTLEEVAAVYKAGPLEVAIKAREAGKIRYIGFTGHYTPETHTEMIGRGFEWDTVQMPLSVLDYHYRSFQEAVLPLANEKNLGVIAMKTLGGFPESIMSTGKVTARECMHYAMSLPVSAVCSGMDTMAVLRENLETAKQFTPMAEEAQAELLARAAEPAADGSLEIYKTRWHSA